ncbi:MAG: hypothetical protein AB7K71_37150, partial [Polyangiaceae bacterium]
SLLVRVSPAERDELLAGPHVSPMQLGKRTMRGFVRIAAPAYRTPASLKRWVLRGTRREQSRADGRLGARPHGTGFRVTR